MTLCGHTKLQLPHWMQRSGSQSATRSDDIALLESGGAAGIGAIHRQCADRQVVAATGHHRRGDVLHERRRVGRHDRWQVAGGVDALGYLDPVQRGNGPVDRGMVARDHIGAAPAVGLGDRVLDPLDRLLAGQYPGDGEEARLQHGVRAPGEPGLARDLVGVDGVDVEALGNDLLLHRAGQRRPDLRRGVRAVEQQGRAGRGPVQHVEAVQQAEMMTADEPGLPDKVRRTDRFRPEPQM